MRALTILLLPLLAACGDDFLPASYLADLRVLAVEATPLEVGPGEPVTLRPVLHLPAGEQLTLQRWTFCPFSLGSSAGFRCALPACETTLTVAADGSVTAQPSVLAGACAAKLGAGAGPGAPTLEELPESTETVFSGTYRSSAGTARETVMRLPLYLTGPPAGRNRPPAITRVTLGGQALQAGTPFRAVQPDEELELGVEVDPASLDAFVDEAGRQRTEEALISFFTTAGRFEYDREAGTSVTNTFKAEKLEAGQTEALIYVVARDLRGGQTVAGPFTVPIQ